MSQRKASKIVKGTDYQKFAKKVSAKVNTVVMGADYQEFRYNKKNIPESAVFSTKDNSDADLDKLNTDKDPRQKERPRPNTSGETSEATDPKEQKQEAVKKAKAKSLVDQIKEPTKKKGDTQLKFKGLGKKAKFYYKIGNKTIPSPKNIDYYKEIDVTSQEYKEFKENLVREFEAAEKTKSADPAVKENKEAEIKQG
jgi:hypothetical protein